MLSTIWTQLRQRHFFRPVFFWLIITLISLTATTSQQSSIQALSPPPTRRINIPAFSDTYEWAQTAVLWFGVNDHYTQMPGRNYADVRLAYNEEYLHLRFTVIDYYLWYNTEPDADSDLSQYDAVALYLDTNLDRASSPQNDDYKFLIQARHWEGHTGFHRDARGNGISWDENWSDSWLSLSGMDWSNNGPNDNSGDVDYGWDGYIFVPWNTLGLSGPPAEGTIWGMGLELFDRDNQPPAGAVTPQTWPEQTNAENPATWGELHFGDASYIPSTTAVSGTTTIRANSPTDNTVEDAWLGGGSGCLGGRNGGSEDNHGDDESLFTGTEIRPVHFPCFNKSFLRFDLNSIPPGKEIISAELTLHTWGYAGETPDLALPSYVGIHSIKDPWQEMGIHWNNAPLAYENISATWVLPYSGDRNNPVWPGDPVTWDASKAVAEAYSANQPVSIALYGSDTAEHSSKYFTSSEIGDWNAIGRPTLVVAWGEGQPMLSKTAVPAYGSTNDTITYTIRLQGDGSTPNLVDDVPTGLDVQTGSLTGGLTYNAAQHQLTWNGTLAAGEEKTFTYQTTITSSAREALTNQVTVSNTTTTTTAEATIIVDPLHVYLPVIQR